MAKLFEKLADIGVYAEWAPLLDWLFDDNKFDNWSSGYVGSLSKKIKRLEFFGDNNYVYDTYKSINYPNEKDKKSIKVIMTRGDGEAKDIIRHIRNGIAHGKSTIYKTKGTTFIEILDYNMKKQQTAYIYIPLEYISRIFTLFNDVEKSKNNDRNNKKVLKRAA